MKLKSCFLLLLSHNRIQDVCVLGTRVRRLEAGQQWRKKSDRTEARTCSGFKNIPPRHHYYHNYYYYWVECSQLPACKAKKQLYRIRCCHISDDVAECRKPTQKSLGTKPLRLRGRTTTTELHTQKSHFVPGRKKSPQSYKNKSVKDNKALQPCHKQRRNMQSVFPKYAANVMESFNFVVWL